MMQTSISFSEANPVRAHPASRPVQSDAQIPAQLKALQRTAMRARTRRSFQWMIGRFSDRACWHGSRLRSPPACDAAPPARAGSPRRSPTSRFPSGRPIWHPRRPYRHRSRPFRRGIRETPGAAGTERPRALAFLDPLVQLLEGLVSIILVLAGPIRRMGRRPSCTNRRRVRSPGNSRSIRNAP